MKFILKKEGFTLIEIIISIAIFVVIMTILMINYRQGGNNDIFRLQAFDIEDSIKSVQNMALTGKEIDDSIPQAYGIFLGGASRDIIIYGDQDGDNVFKKSQDSIYSRNILQEGVNFGEHLSFCDSPIFSDNLDIVFVPPALTVIINNDLTCTSSVIDLRSTRIDGIWNIFFDAITGRAWTEFN
jgi:prepilin-type N-terminal cleavage/methylation domain-containing protein